MEQTIKAIETEYKGYRFRSRLEARWAVFFDALGMKWEYEKEGFDLGEAGRYLPDFYFDSFILEGHHAYCEIKPELPAPDTDEAKRMMTFAGMVAPHYLHFIIAGSPDPEMPVILACIRPGNELTVGVLGYIDYKQHSQFCITWYDPEDEFSQVMLCEEGIWKLPNGYDAISAFSTAERIKKALRKARSARFEFGEAG